MTTNKIIAATTPLTMTLAYEDAPIAPQWNKRAEQLSSTPLQRARQMWYSYFTASSRRRK